MKSPRDLKKTTDFFFLRVQFILEARSGSLTSPSPDVLSKDAVKTIRLSAKNAKLSYSRRT